MRKELTECVYIKIQGIDSELLQGKEQLLFLFIAQCPAHTVVHPAEAKTGP